MSTILHVTLYAPNTTIGRFAFYGCHNMKTIYTLFNVASIPEFSFYVNDIVIQHDVDAMVSNCVLNRFVTFGIGSSIEVDETVIFNDCNIVIKLNMKKKKKWEKSYIKGNAEGSRSFSHHVLILLFSSSHVSKRKEFKILLMIVLVE